MKLRQVVILIFILCLALYGCKVNRPLSNYDVSYIYQPGKTLATYKTLDRGDSIEIYVGLNNVTSFGKMTEQEFRNTYKLYYSLVHSLHSKSMLMEDSLVKNNLTISKSQTTFFLRFRIAKIPSLSNALLILYRNDINRNYTDIDLIDIDFDLEKKNKNLLFSYQLSNCFYLNNYLPLGDSISILSGNDETKEISGSLFKHTFSAASPPHRNLDSTIHHPKADSTFSLNINTQVILKSKGLYIFKKDPKKKGGTSVIINPNKFPRITTAEEMIEPLCYITNRKDFAKIKNTPNPKATIDSFWLKIGSNKDYSRALIKAYYEKVEYSNLAFTSYKEGWKTDRGMIYIVFGRPDEVYKYENSEEWVYENVTSKLLTFTFERKTEDFSVEDFELRRNSQYQDSWYSAIEKWRNGIITK